MEIEAIQTHSQYELVSNIILLVISAEGNSKNCLCSYTLMSLLMLNEGRLMQHQGRLRLDVQH